MTTEDDQNGETQSLASPIVPASQEESRTRKKGIYVGMKLVDRYLIEKELGRGGIGVVYLARDRQLHLRPVVIKVLLEESGQNVWFEKKFRQEIEALARIDHPGVVGVLGAGETPDQKPFIVMQYVKGTTLGAKMAEGRMDFQRIAHIMRQVSQALNVAHDEEIIHCDLKPDNIMLQDLGQGEELAKILDFGIAKIKNSQVAAISDSTKVAGTPHYMAPEQLLGHPSMASDIYALGIITYEMVTGVRPFQPDSPYELLQVRQAGVKTLPRKLRPDLPEAAQEVILKALQFEPENRYQQAREFGQALQQALAAEPEPGGAPTPMQVMLLYKAGVQPDEQVKQLLYARLSANGYKVFTGPDRPPGVEWAKEIESQIRRADTLIVLLSADSVQSETLAYILELANEAAQQQKSKPRLVAVRVTFDESLPDPLLGLLNRAQRISWDGPSDNEQLLEELLDHLREHQGMASPSWRLDFLSGSHTTESVYGAVPLNSRFYIIRPTDRAMHTAIVRRESIVLVKGARQMGKTSLLARGMQQARDAKAKVVLTDFQKLNASHLESIESLFLTLAEMIADQLEIDTLPDQVWSPRRGPSMNFEGYIRRYVLGKTEQSVVWGLDEVDRLATCKYASEVFGLFRSWHNERSLDPEGPWNRLTMIIGYATEAHLFITDLNQSPFNVGTKLVLEDFTPEQVGDLNQRYDSPLKEGEELPRFFALLSGHPYLVRRGLHEMVNRGIGLNEFEAEADRDEGLFSDHLHRILILLAQDPDLSEVMKAVLRGQPCPNDISFYRLRSAGVISGDYARDARARCLLYANYLKRHLL
jgi:AAA-like domain/Protein kinase domain/TIR domain